MRRRWAALRPGTRTGLVAYAGTAHLVLPLTTDAGVIDYFASELAPDVMPQEGDAPVRAVELAARRTVPGSRFGRFVLFQPVAHPFPELFLFWCEIEVHEVFSRYSGAAAASICFR